MVEKITNDERERLAIAKMNKLNSDLKFRREVFETHFNDKFEENNQEWIKLNDKQKLDVVKKIQELDDKVLITQAKQVYRWNINQQLKYLIVLKDLELKNYGVRK